MEAGEENRPFVKEHIIPSRKKLQKEFLKSLGRIFLFGAVFGISAGIFFVMTENFFEKEKEVSEQQETENISAKSDNLNDSNLQETKEENVQEPEEENVQNPIIEKEDPSTMDNKDNNSSYEKKIKEWNQSIVAISMLSQWMGGQVIYEKSAGFGIAVAKDDSRLYFLTKYTFLATGPDSLQIEFFDGVSCPAKLAGKDEDADIAVITVENDQVPKSIQEKIKIIEMGDNRQMKTGDFVLLLGRPNGSLYSADVGIISGTSEKEYIIDYSLDIYPTNIVRNENGSGVVISLDGKLIGVMVDSNQSTFGKNTVVFSSISSLKRIITKIIEQKPILYCGIRAEDIPQQKRMDMGITNGIYVMEIEPNSPAERAGMRTGDIIQKVEEAEITSVTDFYTEISEYSNNEQIDIYAVQASSEKRKNNKYIVRLKEKE